MEEIYSYSDYRAYIIDWVKAQPKKGHGQFRKIALFLRIAPVTITQIVKGDRELQPELAVPLADFLGLSSLEKKFFLQLVLLAQAGTKALKDMIQEQIDRLRADSQSLKNRVPSEGKLSQDALATFHSSWVYSAVRLLTAKDKITAREISQTFSISLAKVETVLEFLVSNGLCRQEKNYYVMGPQRTHLPEESAFILPRQLSWRHKAAERMHRPLQDELFYTAPMVMAAEDFPKVRKEILQFIERVNAIVLPSKNEDLVCLNIDWFQVSANK